MKVTMSLAFCLVLCATALGQSWQDGPPSPFQFCRFDGEYFPTTNRVYFLGGRIGLATTSGRVWSYKPDSGTYHDMGAFASDVGQLSRIVTLNDVSIDATKSGNLQMEATARTFRYLDEEEIAAQRKAQQAARKGRRR